MAALLVMVPLARLRSAPKLPLDVRLMVPSLVKLACAATVADRPAMPSRTMVCAAATSPLMRLLVELPVKIKVPVPVEPLPMFSVELRMLMALPVKSPPLKSSVSLLKLKAPLLLTVPAFCSKVA